jgi:hypothetical protein
MCEFDIENVEYSYLSSLDVGSDPEQAGVSFSIKVGKIYEEQVYPAFTNMYLVDKYLNGFDRAIRKKLIDPGIEDLGSENFNSTERNANFNLDPEMYTAIAQELYAQDLSHESGASFNEQTNSKNLFGARAAGPDGKLFTNDDNIAKIDPTNPATWIGNAINFGSSFLKNTLETVIDKARVTSIPGLGLSFNEAQAALESKNIITAFGIVRKAIDQVARDYTQPSELLDGKIQDEIFRNYLNEIVKSEATENNMQLQQAANMILNDDGIWGQIKDYSRATDLVSNGEVNINNPIEGGGNYQDTVNDSTHGDKSLATNLVGPGEQNIEKTISVGTIIEGIPTSKATSSKILKG